MLTLLEYDRTIPFFIVGDVVKFIPERIGSNTYKDCYVVTKVYEQSSHSKCMMVDIESMKDGTVVNYFWQIRFGLCNKEGNIVAEYPLVRIS